jgi:hypothetical protein
MWIVWILLGFNEVLSCFAWTCSSLTPEPIIIADIYMVELVGIEPTASSLRTTRSPS